MKSIISFAIMLLSSIVAIGQNLEVESKLQHQAFEILTSDEFRKDANGIPCALVKVQLPMENVKFEGNVIDSEYKTNEYWVFLSAGSKRLRIKCPGALPLDIDATEIEPNGLKSKTIYSISLHFNSLNQPIAAAKNIPIKEFFVEDLVTNAFGFMPINNLLKESKTTYETAKAAGLNPTLKDNGDVSVFMTSEPEKCSGFNAVKMLCKIEGSDIIPENTSMGYEPSKYSDGRITYQFSWPHANNTESRKIGREKSVEFSKYILNQLTNAGYDMSGDYKSSKCLTSLGEITLVCNDNYGSCWVGLYVDTYYKKNE